MIVGGETFEVFISASSSFKKIEYYPGSSFCCLVKT